MREILRWSPVFPKSSTCLAEASSSNLNPVFQRQSTFQLEFYPYAFHLLIPLKSPKCYWRKVFDVQRVTRKNHNMIPSKAFYCQTRNRMLVNKLVNQNEVTVRDITALISAPALASSCASQSLSFCSPFPFRWPAPFVSHPCFSSTLSAGRVRSPIVQQRQTGLPLVSAHIYRGRNTYQEEFCCSREDNCIFKRSE